ncbi:hypothetical protein DFP73DRAFT_588761 [Morchella snyderi]|nr:hypothetical protein DFP73DRAFT_588761 [Morchella snyderi]
MSLEGPRDSLDIGHATERGVPIRTMVLKRYYGGKLRIYGDRLIGNYTKCLPPIQKGSNGIVYTVPQPPMIQKNKLLPLCAIVTFTVRLLFRPPGPVLLIPSNLEHSSPPKAPIPHPQRHPRDTYLPPLFLPPRPFRPRTQGPANPRGLPDSTDTSFQHHPRDAPRGQKQQLHLTAQHHKDQLLPASCICICDYKQLCIYPEASPPAHTRRRNYRVRRRFTLRITRPLRRRGPAGPAGPAVIQHAEPSPRWPTRNRDRKTRSRETSRIFSSVQADRSLTLRQAKIRPGHTPVPRHLG